MATTQQQPIEINLGKNIKLIKKIGEGAFGVIYHAMNLKTQFEIAIKLEPIETKHPQLFYETNIYKYLLSDTDVFDKGIPQVYYCLQKGKYNMMAMDLLGPSLEDLFTQCGRKLSLKTVLMLGLQMVNRIEYIHHKTFLHRDVKPDNFLIGTGKRAKSIFIIDFGLAKRYLKNGQHIEFRNDKNLTGTARYASVNTHLGIEQARRDDLESIGYVMMYFLKGMLPWQNLRARTKQEKYQKIKEKKVEVSVEKLCHGHPIEFTNYINYCRNLKFEEKPDYDYLKNLIKGLMKKQGYENDYRYDWVIKKEEKEEKEMQASVAAQQGVLGTKQPPAKDQQKDAQKDAQKDLQKDIQKDVDVDAQNQKQQQQLLKNQAKVSEEKKNTKK